MVVENYYKSVLSHGTTGDKEGKTFDILIEEKPAFVKFYSNNCGHCINMSAAWKMLGEKNNGIEHHGIYIIEVNIDDIKGFERITSKCAENAKNGVPYIAMVNKNGTVFKEYKGDRSAGDMKKFIKDNSKEFIVKNNKPNNKKKVVAGGWFNSRMRKMKRKLFKTRRSRRANKKSKMTKKRRNKH